MNKKCFLLFHKYAKLYFMSLVNRINIRTCFLTCTSFLVILFILFLFSGTVIASEGDSTISAKLKSGGSYELFWPLTAGKTVDEPLYFLKLWKENIQGMLIFNTAKKADYEVMLATKRILEAEKLFKDGKKDLAIQSLEKASSMLIFANLQFSTSTKDGNDLRLVKINLKNQLSNLETFLPILAFDQQSNINAESKVLPKTLDTIKRFINDLQ